MVAVSVIVALYDNANQGQDVAKEVAVETLRKVADWLMYANSVKSAKDAGVSLRYKFSCTKTKDIG